MSQINNPSPFIVFCQKTIPLAFDESMSYMEALYAFKAYLENEVVPAINNNADAVEKIQKWIENLDLQDEVNNKLDEMAESGELTDLIAGYLNLRGILAYNTVAEMKAADNLVDGSFAETYGFYAKDDMGGAKYKIRAVTNADIVDEMTLFALANESLVAELMLENTMNVRQFGAKGDGETDDTAKIQKAIDTVSNVFVPNGTYMVNAVTGIKPNSNNILELSEGSVIKAIANNADNYAVIRISGVNNVALKGGTIEGDRENHTGETGEWGNCVSVINGSTNITIKNIKLIEAWGDGLYINNCDELRTENVTVNHARRNGYSVISATNFHSLNDTIMNVVGTAPQSGVDIEPNNATDKLQNIIFDNLFIKNCKSSGFMIYLANLDATSSECTIKVNNIHVLGDGTENAVNGIDISKNQHIKGFIEFNNPVVESIYHLSFTGKILYSDCPVIINKPRILDYNKSDSTGVSIGSGIYFYNQAEIDGGNISIIEPIFTSNKTSGTPRDIYIKGTNGYPMKNIAIINPLQVKTPNNYLDNCQNVTIEDKKQLLTATPAAGEYYGTYNAYRYLNTKNYNVNRTLTMSSAAPIGYEFTITRGNQYTPTIVFDGTQKCYPLATTNNPSIALGSIGSSISLRKISDTEWMVVNQVGTITVS